jgi:OOP family OmpA-OmpF porin
MKLAPFAALAFALASTPRLARAACDTGLSTCIDADTYWPHAGPAYFNVVGGTATTAPATLGFGWATTYLARPIVLLLPSSQTGGTEVPAISGLWNATFLFSYGVAPRFEVNVAVPTTVYRDGTGISALTRQGGAELSRAGLRDLRVGVTYALLPPPTRETGGFSLASRLQVALPTGDEASFNGDRTAVAIPSLAAEFRRAMLVVGGEVGARLRGTSDLAGTRIGSQLAISFGMGSDLLPDRMLGILIEAIALPTLVDQHELSPVSPQSARTVVGDRRFLMPTEWLASLRTAGLMSGNLSLSLGAGGSLSLTGESGATSPSFRAMLSVRYAPTARVESP